LLVKDDKIKTSLTDETPMPRKPTITDNLQLFTRLIELKDTLSHAGTVYLRKDKGRQPCWRLRVRVFIPSLGYRKMLAIKMPDEQTARAVQQLLNHWRAEHQAKTMALKRSAKDHTAAKRHERAEEREMLRLVAAMAGGSSWTRRNVRREFKQALDQGPVTSALYVLGKEYKRAVVRSRGVRQKSKTKTAQPKGIPKGLWQPLDVRALVRERFKQRRSECPGSLSRERPAKVLGQSAAVLAPPNAQNCV
jgi:hypothetical protein